MAFSDNLKIIRQLRGKKPMDVVEETGISKQNYYAWEKGDNEPGKKFLDQLVKYFDVPRTAFYKENLTEEELSSNSNVKKKSVGKIPFYDAAVVGGTSMLADQDPISKPAEYIDPGDLLRGATGTLRVYGHSMFPKYPPGCIIAFKASNSKVIVWGEDYVIELLDRRIVKRVVKSQEKDCIKAVSYNVNNDKYVYDPIDIPLTEVKRLYMVLGKVEMEASI